MIGFLGFLIICLAFWFFWKLGWAAMKLIYVLCFGLPLALCVGMLGLALCCTILLIPVGTALLRTASWLVWPFRR